MDQEPLKHVKVMRNMKYNEIRILKNMKQEY